MSRRGFSIYLTFVVTTVIFMLAASSQEITMLTLDLSRSDAIDTIVFHGADGGLERGLAKLRKNYTDFKFSYVSNLEPSRTLRVNVEAVKKGNTINLKSEAILTEGNKEVSRRTLSRLGIADSDGRNGKGRFREAI